MAAKALSSAVLVFFCFALPPMLVQALACGLSEDKVDGCLFWSSPCGSEESDDF